MTQRTACLILFLTLISHAAFAGTTTSAIFTQTVQALPSCLKYQVKGVCFWLKCGWGCQVRTSIRIEHFVPDAIVSVYHDKAHHPWADHGTLTIQAIGGFSKGLPGEVDSAGSRFRDDRTSRNWIFRDADAVGHPLAILNFINGGGWPSLIPSSTMSMPSTDEMTNFSSGDAMSEWSNYSNTGNSQNMADLPQTSSQTSSGISSLFSAVTNTFSGGTSLNNAMSNGVNISNLLNNNGGQNSNTGNLPSLSSLTGNMSTSSMGFFCPPGAQPFALYFNSQLDARTWRGMIPAELLYPGSWIPGVREIGNFPSNSWGSVYPRDGNVTQQHVVKAPAIIAQRVGDIITRRQQPHIYSPLIVETEANGFRYFHERRVFENAPHNTTWQRLYPNPEKSCTVFGQNDSLSPVSWGDGNTTPEEGYVWNMWRLYDCCQRAGQAFLFSVP